MSTDPDGWRRRLLVGICAIASATSALHGAPGWAAILREGDIVFTGSKAGQGEAVSAATGSPYTHCGVVFSREGRLMVLEAVQPVRVVPLETFMKGGSAGDFAARRLKRMPEPAALAQAKNWASAQVGRDYDVLFDWGDDRLYCSELVWKVFAKAGVELCPPRKVRDYNLQHPSVRRLIEARYGSVDRLPLDGKIVAPSDLAASPILDVVKPE